MSSRYTNPQGLYDFQAKAVAYTLMRQSNLGVIDTGLGKTHIGLSSCAFHLDDDMVDHVVFVVEKNKLDEWMEDFDTFTSLTVNKFWGPKRSMDVEASVTLTTYHTFRDYLVAGGAQSFAGQRIMVIMDEAALLGGSRTSKMYQAYEDAFAVWRKAGSLKVLMLTATPMQRSPENFYNLDRLLRPDYCGTVRWFMQEFVTKNDPWFRAVAFKDLDLYEKHLSPVMIRKRKTDPDVIDQFPKTVEKFVHVQLDRNHLAAYRSLEEWIKSQPEDQQLPSFRCLNAFVVHPSSILTSEWEVAQQWIEHYGHEKVAKLKSRKSERVAHYLHEIESQGAGVLVFCESVSALQAFGRDLDLPHVQYHGGQTDSQNRAAKAAFKEGEAKIMLCSSKAERGINLPEAHYIVNLDVPRSHSSYTQRLNRGSRIGSNEGGILTVKTFITRATIEIATTRMWTNRNQWQDDMQDAYVEPDDEFVTAVERKAAIIQARKETSNDQPQQPRPHDLSEPSSGTRRFRHTRASLHEL